jgi:hypothetical protein
VKLDRKQYHRGDVMKVNVQRLRYHAHDRRANVRCATGLPALESGDGFEHGRDDDSRVARRGKYKLTVTAEDFAHNIGSGEVEIEILPNRRVVMAIFVSGGLLALRAELNKWARTSTPGIASKPSFSAA